MAVPDRPMRAAFGALLGARVAGRVDGRRLGRIFAVVVLGAAAAPALDAARAP